MLFLIRPRRFISASTSGTILITQIQVRLPRKGMFSLAIRGSSVSWAALGAGPGQVADQGTDQGVDQVTDPGSSGGQVGFGVDELGEDDRQAGGDDDERGGPGQEEENGVGGAPVPGHGGGGWGGRGGGG